MPVSLPFKSGITLPTALAAPVDDGMMFWDAHLLVNSLGRFQYVDVGSPGLVCPGIGAQVSDADEARCHGRDAVCGNRY